MLRKLYVMRKSIDRTGTALFVSLEWQSSPGLTAIGLHNVE